MVDSVISTEPARFLDRKWMSRFTDGLAAAVAASLPWSTSLTGILIAAWFVALLPTLEPGALRREVLSPAGGLPLILLGLAALGMAWADVTVSERLAGLDGFFKLLFIPFLLVQFRLSSRGWWVVVAFLGGSLVLLVLSWGLALIPDLPWRGKAPGVPVKDYISQSAIFTLCAFALLGGAVEAWRCHQRQLALMLALIAAAFGANIAFVETSRTTLVTLAVLVPLFGLRHFGWRGLLGAGVTGCALAGTVWISSSYLRERVIHAVEEVRSYQSEHEETSAGLRLDFWKNSIHAIARAPIAGNGTGSIPEQLRSTISAETGVASFATVNPHNQVLVVAIQLGATGVVALLAMWIAHLIRFRGDGVIAWIGTVAVVENMVGSIFNSHISDFTHGWLYVFAVGVLGGMAIRPAGQDRPGIPLRSS
jgi:O-antigen ligase